MNRSFQNWLIVFGITVVSGIIFYFALPRKSIEDNQEVMGIKSSSYKYIPYITSIAPRAINLGEYLKYEVIVSDLDSEDDEIVTSLEEGPGWIYLEGNTVRGLPLEIGTYKYIVRVTDGENSSSQVNYILVEENE